MSEQQRPLQAQDKLAVLLALVPYLIDRERVPVDEAAAHFALPAHAIRDAVRLIAVSGVPGDTRAYQVDDLFDIDWDAFLDDDEIVLTHRVALDDAPRFSAREAAALIAGLQYLSAIPENADRALIAGLMDKLSRGASARPSALAVESRAVDASLAVVRTAIDAGEQLAFEYRNARGDRELRTVDPLRLDSLDADWYLRAYDHGRDAVRTFRIDRMRDPRPTGEPRSELAEGLVPGEQLFEGGADDSTVTVSLPTAALGLIADYRPDAVADAGGDRSTARLRIAGGTGLARLAASLGGALEVLEPASAREAVAAWARDAAQRYRA